MLNIFISYSQDDFSGGARHVKNYISKHVQESDVFLDQSKTKGTMWRKEIEDKVESSNIFIVLLTHGSLESEEVEKEVNLAKKKKERRIIPCKENLLEIDWENTPWDLYEYDGISFDDIEELGRKLVTEIKKIGKETIKPNVEHLALSGHVSLLNRGIVHALSYVITNGEVLSAISDQESSSIIVSIASFGDGNLTLDLPRSIIDAKNKSNDDSLFTLIDGMEVEHSEEINEFRRTIVIPFKKDNGKIWIIGTQLFGVSFSGISKEENTIRFLQGGGNMQKNVEYLKPEILKMRFGEKIKWVNTDTVSHTVTSGKVSDDNAGSMFDSGLVKPGGIFEIVLNIKGTYHYFDTVHPWITGQVIVE